MKTNKYTKGLAAAAIGLPGPPRDENTGDSKTDGVGKIQKKILPPG